MKRGVESTFWFTVHLLSSLLTCRWLAFWRLLSAFQPGSIPRVSRFTVGALNATLYMCVTYYRYSGTNQGYWPIIFRKMKERLSSPLTGVWRIFAILWIGYFMLAITYAAQ